MRREDLVRTLAEAVINVPGVAGLAAGRYVEVATHFSGGKVVGIRLSDPIEIHIVADQLPLQPVADSVVAAARRVLLAAAEERDVLVVIDDVTAPALERRGS